jgi:hypothetical protein
MNKESIGSKTAKGGLNEQEFIKNLINSNVYFRKKINKKFKIKLTEDTHIINGNSKTDICSNGINIQVKRTKNKQFGQIDRHYVSNLIENIPKLKEIEYMLNGICELPIIDVNGKKMCDKTKNIKKISSENYSDEEIENFLNVFENNKKKILKYAFYGIIKDKKPEIYVCSVFSSQREYIIIWKTSDIIDEILKNNVAIRKSKTVIEIGKCFTFQRKGGDGGKKCANNFQFKLIPTLISTKKALIFKL